LHENGTCVRTELLAGVTTFVTLSYILFVQPAVLSAAGMDFGAVLLATCVASALGCVLMGLLANYPVAMAPAMGHNLLRVAGRRDGSLPIYGDGWLQLGRRALRSALARRAPGAPLERRRARYSGDRGRDRALFAVGLEWGGRVVRRGDLHRSSGSVPCARGPLAGLLAAALLLVRRVRGAIWRIAVAAVAAVGTVEFSVPPPHRAAGGLAARREALRTGNRSLSS
jgi:xanthine/uracil/vitamin C permease (AzgA family)